MSDQQTASEEYTPISTIDPTDWGNYYLWGLVEPKMALEFIMWLDKMETLSPDLGEINITMSSPGGCVSSGFAIIDAIQKSPFKVNIMATGECFSMAVLILLSATGSRKMQPNCHVMAHQHSTGIEGKSHELDGLMEFNDILKRQFKGYFMDTTGLSEEEIDEHLLNKTDVYFTAFDMYELGLIDEIIGYDCVEEVDTEEEAE